MNPNYMHTITLYHRKTDGTWSHLVLHGCFFKAVTNVSHATEQAVTSNTYTVRIPMSAIEKPMEHLGTDTNDVIRTENCIALGFVSDEMVVVACDDIVVLGECTDVISNTAGYRAAEVLRRYKPNAFKVTSVADNTSHLMDKHWRLGG